MSDDLQFSMRRSWALVLAGCLAVATILLFFAGTVTGLLYSGDRGKTAQVAALSPAAKPTQSGAEIAPAKPVVDIAAAPPAELPSGRPALASDPANNPTPNEAGPVALPSSTGVLPVPPLAVAKPKPPQPATSADFVTALTAAGVSTKPPAPEASAAPARPVEASSLVIPLAVQVGAFAIKSNATTLAQSLRDMGYKPAISRSTDTRGRVWYLVKLGPYSKWNAASRVAARISITENVRPVIGPMQ
jgi:cell division septation protein DedD